MRKSYLIILGLAIALVGCKREETLTIDYFKANDKVRLAKIKECSSNPGELEHTPNCKNAMAAQVQLEFSTDNKTMPGIR